MVDASKLEALARKAEALHENERVSRYVSFVAPGIGWRDAADGLLARLGVAEAVSHAAYEGGKK